MRISPNEKEVEKFFSQLKKFVRWLDRKAGTSWYNLVAQLSIDSAPELKTCEKLLNRLFLIHFPRIHYKDWNLQQEIEKAKHDDEQCDETISSLFQVDKIHGEIIILKDLDTDASYSIAGMPTELITPGILLNGLIGKRNQEMLWNWHLTEGIFPQKAKHYFEDKNTVIFL